MSLLNKKVLLVDKNNYYGGESASMTPLSQFYSHFSRNYPSQNFKSGQTWNIDLIMKFIMADGLLVKLLIFTGVDNYITFASVDGSYVYHAEEIHKVPADEVEALSSDMMGFFEKRRFKNLLNWMSNFDITDNNTYKDVYSDPMKETIEPLFSYYEISEATQTFLGHAICLYLNDDYKTTESVNDVIKRVKLYQDSLLSFGYSPYLYPLYGLGELPQGFARLNAVHGGTVRLNCSVDEFHYDKAGSIRGVTLAGQFVKCPLIICDPSYMPLKCKQVNRVIRAICFLKHTIAGTYDSLSCNIIIPNKMANRKSDIYICCVSYHLKVSEQPYIIASVSTVIETNDPKSELNIALNLLNPIEEIFYSESNVMEPIDKSFKDKVFITSSYDATSHLESCVEDVLNIYEKITGEPFNFDLIKKKVDAVS